MKIKNFLNIFFLLFLIITNVLLCVYITKSDSIYKYEYKDEIVRDESIIPNKETAERVAKVVIETQDEYVSGIDDDIEYEVIVEFDEEKYEWVVHYMPKKEGYVIFGGEIIIRIRKDNGRICIGYGI